MRKRRVKIAAIVSTTLLTAYMLAFFTSVGAVHVSYYDHGAEPRPPRFIMYVSDDSTRLNAIALYAFYPLIKACEATGDFQYVIDASDFMMESAPLWPKLWAVLRA